jgi:16S rRNA (cytidine1402-2'-O)-methyltransferase
MTSLGRLFLIPTPLGDDAEPEVLPAATLGILARISHFVVENKKSPWRFLARHFSQDRLNAISLSVLDEHSRAEDIPGLLQPALNGFDLGVISEAGCPGIADPGADLARAAHLAGVGVTPLVGPSSIVLALMASGFSGQSFHFHGYLPRERPERQKAIRRLERAAREGASQIFIETPYRNAQMLDDLGASLSADTEVFIAMNLTQSRQLVRRCRAEDLGRYPELRQKEPAVFIIGG